MLDPTSLRRALFWFGVSFTLFAIIQDPRLLHLHLRMIGIILIIISGSMCVVLGIREIGDRIYGDPDCPWYCHLFGFAFFAIVSTLSVFLAVKAALEMRPDLGVVAGVDPYAVMLSGFAAELFWLLILEPPPAPYDEPASSVPELPPPKPITQNAKPFTDSDRASSEPFDLADEAFLSSSSLLEDAYDE